MKIKSRKQRMQEYEKMYGNISIDVYERLQNFLGDRFNEDLLNSVKDRINEAQKNLKYYQIKMTFYEEPMQSHRPRVNYHTRGLHVPLAKENMQYMKKFLSKLNKDIHIISVPMKIDLVAYLPMPPGIKDVEVVLYELGHDMAFSKPDFDNILKAYVDMIQDSLLLDDDMVAESTFRKYYSLKPRVELTITYTNGYVSEHTYKKITGRKSFKDIKDLVDAELIVTPIQKRKSKKKEK